MNSLRPKDLRHAAGTLAAPARPIVIRHTAVYLAVGLLLALTALVCDLLMERTGGLGDMGKRTLISTVEMLITLAAQAFLPLWTAGFTCCAIGFARSQSVETGHLLGGLRRWGVLLRLSLCQSFVYFAASYALLMVVMPVFLVTPWGTTLLESMTGILYTSTELTPEIQSAVISAMGPLYVVWIPLVMALSLFLSYQFRLALYRVLDADRPGAVRAMWESCRLIHRHRWQLVKLDLSWWWYYLLSALLSLILYVPELLTLLEVSLPVDSNILYLVCYLVYAVALGLLYLTSLAKVETSYALFYDHLVNASSATPSNRAQS